MCGKVFFPTMVPSLCEILYVYVRTMNSDYKCGSELKCNSFDLWFKGNG